MLRNAATLRKQVDLAAIERDDACVLGRWLGEEAKRLYGETEAYQDLLAKHLEFHKQAGIVGRAINGRQYEKVHEMLKLNSPYMRAADAVGLAIIRMKYVVK